MQAELFVAIRKCTEISDCLYEVVRAVMVHCVLCGGTGLSATDGPSQHSVKSAEDVVR